MEGKWAVTPTMLSRNVASVRGDEGTDWAKTLHSRTGAHPLWRGVVPRRSQRRQMDSLRHRLVGSHERSRSEPRDRRAAANRMNDAIGSRGGKTPSMLNATAVRPVPPTSAERSADGSRVFSTHPSFLHPTVARENLCRDSTSHLPHWTVSNVPSRGSADRPHSIDRPGAERIRAVRQREI
jgi:hypothetical protein